MIETFKEICRMTQPQLKAHLRKELVKAKYDPICREGFLCAQGNVPVLLVAHLDTVHKEKCVDIEQKDEYTLTSPQGIGGDDRCGVFIIMNIIKELNCSVLFCEDEETGEQGARKFANSDFIKYLNVNYIIEFDRKGFEDAVFYKCDNKEFTDFILHNTPFKKATGTFSDISVIAPAAKIAAVNLSSGYYNAHHTTEYVDFADMMNTIEVAKDLIKTESKKFEYVAAPVASQMSFFDGGYGNFFDGKRNQTTYESPVRGRFSGINFNLVELEVVWVDDNGEEWSNTSVGKSKAEALANFFIENPDVCFNMIEDYNFF